MYTYIPSCLSLPPPHYMLYRSFPLAFYFTHSSIYVSTTLFICPTFSFSLCVHKSILYVCISIPTLQVDFRFYLFIFFVILKAVLSLHSILLGYILLLSFSVYRDFMQGSITCFIFNENSKLPREVPFVLTILTFKGKIKAEISALLTNMHPQFQTHWSNHI